MNLKLRNKVIVVTGGASGIGKAITECLVKENAIPFIIDKNETNLSATVQSHISRNKKVFYYKADLTDQNQCNEAFKYIKKEAKSIDGLVNNAGINDGIGLESGSAKEFLASYHKNAVHYYYMAKLCLPDLKKKKGPIVNISSKVATTGQGGTSGYAASIGARNALTREWAVELLPYGIRVNAVVVAECFTPLYKKWVSKFNDPQKKINEIESRIPLKNRMTKPKEIANTVVFLLSEKSGHTTGQLIYIDGGYTHLDRAI
ncbi:MAG: SDR family oxidoreductase [Flavobacteriaceae bacterium]|nr:SDR family oxidoreductase [Flavobacteriaceae bacterium]